MKKIVSGLLSTVLLLTPGTALAADQATFRDVSEEHWAYNAIETFARQGIVSGNGDGTFAPNDHVTREQFAKMLTLTFEIAPQPEAQPSFRDVETSRWSFAYIEAAKDDLPGFADADGGKPSYQPSQPALREDIAAALVRALQYPADAADGSSAQTAFSDHAAISEDLASLIGVAAKKGIVTGYPDGTFRPRSSVTRAEAVIMLSRAAALRPTSEEDVPKLTLDSYQDVVDTNQITLSGTVTDAADPTPTLTVNGSPVTVSASGRFSTPISLRTGQNEITLTASNKTGKTVVKVCTIQYKPKTPSYIDNGDRYWAYMTSDSYTDTISGDSVTAYPVWTGEFNDTLYFDGIGPKKHVGQIVKYLTTGEYIEFVTLPDEAIHAVAITGIEYKIEGAIAVKGDTLNGTYSMRDDCVFVAINDDRQEGMDGGTLEQLSLAEQLTSGAYYLNAYVIGDSSGKIMAVFYDADSNRLAGDRTVY